MAPMLPRLFFVHFEGTSYVVDDEDGQLAAFLIGFLSQTSDDEAYIHFVGVSPEQRGAGLGRLLYERFFDDVRAQGRTTVHCVTSPRTRARSPSTGHWGSRSSGRHGLRRPGRGPLVRLCSPAIRQKPSSGLIRSRADPEGAAVGSQDRARSLLRLPSDRLPMSGPFLRPHRPLPNRSDVRAVMSVAAASSSCSRSRRRCRPVGRRRPARRALRGRGLARAQLAGARDDDRRGRRRWPERGRSPPGRAGRGCAAGDTAHPAAGPRRFDDDHGSELRARPRLDEALEEALDEGTVEPRPRATRPPRRGGASRSPTSSRPFPRPPGEPTRPPLRRPRARRRGRRRGEAPCASSRRVPGQASTAVPYGARCGRCRLPSSSRSSAPVPSSRRRRRRGRGADRATRRRAATRAVRRRECRRSPRRACAPSCARAAEDGSLGLTLDPKGLGASLRIRLGAFERPPRRRDVRRERQPGARRAVEAGTDARPSSGSARSLTKNLELDDAPGVVLALASPAFTTEEAEGLDIRELVSEFTTYYPAASRA